MFNRDIPVYVMAGFLESGKTHMVKELLTDPQFTEQEKTLLVVCEDGEEQYEEEILTKSRTTMVQVEDKSEFTYGFLAKLNKRQRPDRVIIEYNGTWPIADLMQMELPAGWAIAQVITPINAQTFDLYINNMRQMMVEHISAADLILFNRCTKQTPLATYWRNMKMTNRAAVLIFEDEQGEVLEVNSEEILPYSLKDPVIDVADDDFGIFYVDAMENPDRYEGKEVRFTGMVYHEKSFPDGYFVPGRFAMTCCANDMQFMGYLCRSKQSNQLKNETWVKVTAKIHREYMKAYGGEAPVLYATKIEITEKPKNEFVYLY